MIQAHAAAAPVRRGLETGDAGPRTRAGGELLDPRLGSGHLSLLCNPHQSRAGYLHFGDSTSGRGILGSCINQRIPRQERRRRKRDWAEQGPGYTSFSGPGIEAYEDLSFWAAGHEPAIFLGDRQRLSRQSDVVLQIHYHPTGKPEVDRTRIGVYYSREPVKQALHWSTVSNSDFHLPAGDPNVEVKASWFIPVDVEVLAVSPHMHQLGRDMSMSVTLRMAASKT